MLAITAAVFLGIFTWSLLEYVIHRWAGHDKRLTGNFFGVEHIAHHSRGHYFAPNWKKAGAAAVAAAILIGPAVLVAGVALGTAWVAGTVGFYLYYELLHRLEHVNGGYTAYGRWARKHHFYHHFHNPSVNHGVTSPIWDWAFGTLVQVERVRVPEKLMMPWLLDAHGEVRAEYADIYEVRRKKKAA
jgi:4-hydroxysphinganine ceramide fatty acyl 2-hydroxylase